MGNPEARIAILKESRGRVRRMVFGDPVTNVCAGESGRHGYFVRVIGDNAQVTDKKGYFGNYGCEVIYPGHLSADECSRLFEPFWQAQYGQPPIRETDAHD